MTGSARLLRLPSVVFAALAVLACDDPTRALEPVWHKQACDHCHMVLSEPRFAAQVTDDAGQRSYFDDVGCMAVYVDEHRGARLRKWVRDGAHWVDAERMRYARGASTPMGYGFAPSARGELDFHAVLRSVVSGREVARTEEP